MPSASEALAATGGDLKAILDAAINSLDPVTLSFTVYNRVAIASDKSVFWVKTSASSTALGSLHYSTEQYQDADETVGSNLVIFTSESQVIEFNAVSPTTMVIADWTSPEADAPALRIAFSRRAAFDKAASIWHYAGVPLLPQFGTQVVDDISDVPTGPIVSNSTPIWVNMAFQPSDAAAVVPCFPSHLVPKNMPPPYIVAHIGENDTKALQSFPFFGPWPGTTVPNSGNSPLHLLSSSQQMQDQVTLTLVGFNAADAAQFQAYLMGLSMGGTFGFASDLFVSDHKHPQVEFTTLAQKKSVRFGANYDIQTANATASRLILQAGFSSFTVGSVVSPVNPDPPPSTPTSLIFSPGQVYPVVSRTGA